MADITVHFLDVGQGDGTYIETNGKKILVDLGTTKNSKDTWPEIKEFFIKQKGFKKGEVEIEYLFLTHPDRDHYNLIEKFNRAFSPSYKNIIIGGRPWGYYQSQYQNCPHCGRKTNIGKTVEVYERAPKSGRWRSYKKRCDYMLGCGQKFEIDVKIPPAFDKWLYDLVKAGKVTLPSSNWTETIDLGGDSKIGVMAGNLSSGDSNGKSIVLRIYNNAWSVMLSADATVDTEAFILDNHSADDIKSDVLKVGHHGSARTSTSSEWAAAVDPELAYVSSDRTGDLLKSSGFKIPSQASIDTLLQFGTRLNTADAAAHKFVVYFPDKFYGNSRSVKSFDKKSGSGSAAGLNPQIITSMTDLGTVADHYIEIRTELNVFTNLCTLGDSTSEDIGVRYDLQLPESGALSINPSSDDPSDFTGWPSSAVYRIPTG
ncbi:hypothetical protein BFP97_00745 [Roseivirga sp. 4D4]|uniref:ComEC/Rec2 family competence protein n=1 Tax=Roseivirga sp. 4D4 TaxID=1889784 RepID=UPI00085304B7|nr:MBL fold metallo-hydrolase [Roseivirga sp. 4D4]OEK00130.1 hypothetical protein BFP97_00745 [Roseivirga sp. 4D4]